MKILFVTWDGPGPNYHESLFLPIFARSRRPGDEVHLLQYAWDADDRTASVRATARRLGMPYSVRGAWRRPQGPATAGMILKGGLDLAGYALRHRIDVLMPRSIIPAGMALLAQGATPGVRLLFDADGLMADERADFAGWRRDGVPYRTLRAIERAAVRRADVTITRTRRAKSLLAERAALSDPDRIVVVSNGKDAEAFSPGTEAERAETRRSLGVPDGAPLLVYVGSLGPHYYPDRVTAFAAAVRARSPGAHLLMLTGATDRANQAARAHALDDDAFTVRRVPPDDVPRFLSAADLGLAFRTASLSQRAVAPIKVGEYLLCGTPVLSTAGIGDLGEQLDESTAKLVRDVDDEALADAAGWLTDKVLPARNEFRAACRTKGLEHYSLATSTARYREAFARLRPPA